MLIVLKKVLIFVLLIPKTLAMNDEQTNQLAMYEEVNDTLDANADIVKTVKPAQDGHVFLKGRIVEIQIQYGIQQKITTGITDSKQQVRTEYEKSIFKVAGGLLAHAAANDDKELLAIADTSASKLSIMREEKLLEYGKSIYDRAIPLQTQLAELLVSANDIALLNTNREAFNVLMPKKRTAVGAIATATDNLTGLFRETNSFLKTKLDKIMIVFHATHPDFYKQYQSARIIVDRGHGGEHEKEGDGN